VAFGQRSACADQKVPPRIGEGRRSARKRLRRPISIGGKASGQRPACADRKSTLRVSEGRRPARSAFEGRFQSAQKPPANGRPAPTRKTLLASAKADARRTAPWKADFNRHESLRPTVGLHAE
jgi:hypothetical protein